MDATDSIIEALKSARDPRLTVISFVSDAVNRALDLKEIADNALDSVLSVMELEAGAVYAWQDEQAELRLFASRGLSDDFVKQAAVVHRGSDETINAVLAGKTQVVEDLRLTVEETSEGTARAGFVSAVLAPICAQGYVVGLLCWAAGRRDRSPRTTSA